MSRYVVFFLQFSSTCTHCMWFGFPVAHKQSWTSRNPGRRFVTCKFYNQKTGLKGCELFMWERHVINQVLLEKNLLERQVDHLKLRVCNAEDQKNNLAKDNERNKAEYEKALAALESKNRTSANVSVSFHFVVFVAIVVVLLLVVMLFKN